MERFLFCPSCLSKHEDIHGVIYAVGKVVGTQCDDLWHKGWISDPDKWVLTAYDQEFLSEQKVSSR